MARSFLSSVLTVAGGTALAQGIGLVSLPFITRLYAPEVYGTFVLLLAYGGVLAPVVCARFEVALPLLRRDASAGALAWGALAVAALVSLLSAVVLAGVIFAGLVEPAFAFLPVYVMFAGAIQVFGTWCTRQRDFGRLSLSRIAQASLTALLSIGLGHAFGPNPQWLVLATVAGQAASLLVLLVGLPSLALVAGARRLQAWRLLRQCRRVAVFNVPHVLSDTAQSSGLPLLMALFFGTQAAAYYAFSTRLLKAPLGLVANAISQVFYPRAAAHRQDNARLRHDAQRLLMGLVPGALLVWPMVVLVPDTAYAWAFGPAWQSVGGYLRALVPWALSSFIVAPLAVLYVVKQRFALDFSLGLAGTAVAFITLGVVQMAGGNATTAVWALSLSMMLYVLVSAFFEFAVVIGWSHGRGG